MCEVKSNYNKGNANERAELTINVNLIYSKLKENVNLNICEVNENVNLKYVKLTMGRIGQWP